MPKITRNSLTSIRMTPSRSDSEDPSPSLQLEIAVARMVGNTPRVTYSAAISRISRKYAVYFFHHCHPFQLLPVQAADIFEMAVLLIVLSNVSVCVEFEQLQSGIDLLRVQRSHKLLAVLSTITNVLLLKIFSSNSKIPFWGETMNNPMGLTVHGKKWYPRTG